MGAYVNRNGHGRKPNHALNVGSGFAPPLNQPSNMLSRLASNFSRHVVPVSRRAISVQVAASSRARHRALTVSAVRAQSILHGSQEAKEAGDSETQHHSRLIARGKYLHGIESASRPHAQIAMFGTQYRVAHSPSSQAR